MWNVLRMMLGSDKGKVKCTLVQALSSVKAVRPVGGVEV